MVLKLSRKRILLIVFFFLSVVTSIQSQNSINDIEESIKKHIKQDTTKVNLLNELAFKLYIKDKRRTIELVDESEKLSNELEYIKGKSESLYIRGLVNVFKSQNNKAATILKKSLLLFKNSNDKKGVSKCLNALGISYMNTGAYDEALSYYHKSLLINEEIGDDDNVATAFNNKGNIYKYKGDLESAIENYLEAYNIKKKLNRTDHMSMALNNIGNVYSDQCNYPKALEYHNKALSLKRKMNDSIGIAKVLGNIAIVYKQQKNLDKALEYYNIVLGIFKKNEDTKSVISILNNLSSIYYSKKQNNKALELLEESVLLAQQIKDRRQEVTGLNNIAENYVALKEYDKGLDYYHKSLEISNLLSLVQELSKTYIRIAKVYYYKKQHKKALYYISKSEEYGSKYENIEFNTIKNELLSLIYSETGNYKKAFESYTEYKKLSDSLFNEENTRKIAELEYEYKYKQELELANTKTLKLTKKVKKTSSELQKSKQNFLIGVIVFLIIIMLLGLRIFLLKIRHVKSINENVLMEQKLLRSQMTPHFIFNSLSVLQGVILNREPVKAVRHLSKFSKLLRITLENSRDKMVLLEKELEAVEHYMVVQNLGIEFPFKYIIQKKEEINEKEVLVPPMLIQPFVENAIEHAFEENKKDREIIITLEYLKEKLICSIIDNGRGIEAKRQEKNINKKSLATVITKERLEMLSKEFRVDASITIKDRKYKNEKGTEVILTLPYKKAVA